MTSPRIGSLCTGYGGLDLAVEQHYGARTVWVSDVDKNANVIIDQRFPGVPNLGDLTVLDWSQVPAVDILIGGYPCQPFSHAGKREGTKDARHIWPHIRDAVATLRPRVCVFENVQGHLSLGGAEVVASLTSLGYGVQWGLVRASDAGAPHRRARVFIVATADADEQGPQGRRSVGRGRAHQRATRSHSVGFGTYEPAIRRWEHTINRPAPQPTVPTGRNGGHRLNPVFVEWMMGLPEGWVTGTGISHVAQLKALGNGVVPQQASLALQHLTTGAQA